jgi:hypothetical protein
MKTFCQLAVAAAEIVAYDLSGPQTAQFGSAPTGSKVFCKMTPVNQYGVAGTPSIMSTVAQAANTIPEPTLTSPSTGQVTAAWTGGGSFTAYIFPGFPLAATGSGSMGSVVGATPADFTALVTGTRYYVVLTDGVNWGDASVSIVCT